MFLKYVTIIKIFYWNKFQESDKYITILPIFIDYQYHLINVHDSWEATLHTYIYVLCLVIQEKFFQTLFKLFFRVNAFYEQLNLTPNSYYSKNKMMLEFTTPTLG